MLVSESAIPPAPPAAPQPLYTIDRRASSLLAAVEPLKEWRQQNVQGNSPPGDLKAIAEKIDALRAEVCRYVGERLEPHPLPS
jgi:hypothetical protein